MSDSDPQPAERRALLAFVWAIVLAFVWFVVRPLLAPLVLAALLAVIFQPLHRRFEKRLGAGSLGAALTSLGLLTAVVSAPAIALGAAFLGQVRSVVRELVDEEEARSRLVGLVEGSVAWVSDLTRTLVGDPLEVQDLGREALRRLGTTLYQLLPDAVGLTGRLAMGLLILYLVLFYLFFRGRQLVDLLVELAPLEAGHSRRVLERLEQTVDGVFQGILLTALVQGAVGALGFWLTGFNNFLIWGLLIAAAGLIPVVGTGLVWVPATLYLAFTGHPWAAAGMLAVGAVVGTVDNLIKPLVIHERASVHPLLVFLGLIGGLGSLGPMGLVYGPLLVACLTEAIRIYREGLDAPASAAEVRPDESAPAGRSGS